MIDGSKPPVLRDARQITLVGANGAGKTRFMKALMERLPGRAYYLSALSASFPEKKPSQLPGSVDDLYARRVRTKPYMRMDAVSELDKLGYMLVIDEFEHLLQLKARSLGGDVPVSDAPTRLDRLMALWQRIFPGSEILHEAGRLLFANDSGDDPVTALTLSQGEKAVFYYIAATLYAMPGAVIFIDSPTLFLHTAILNTLWNAIEELRPDCTFVYNTVDPDFVNSRTDNVCIWIRSYDAGLKAWDYSVLDYAHITDDLFVDIIGSRKPVLFVEGDASHSIDARLYTLVFSDFTVRPLGSCNKVIETTRTFSDLKRLHHLDSHGIVDRDRRTDSEVEYLRRKNIFVPDVAEVENIFLTEGVMRAMARLRGKDADRVVSRVKQNVIKQFSKQHAAQALQHVRHQMKRSVETKIDARFTCITALETHIRQLIDKLRPREIYNSLLQEFRQMIDTRDYGGILRVFNHKPMLTESAVAPLLGYETAEQYIGGVIAALKRGGPAARELRLAIKNCFGLDMDGHSPLPSDDNVKKQDATAPGTAGFPFAPKREYEPRYKKNRKNRAGKRKNGATKC